MNKVYLGCIKFGLSENYR